MKIQVEWEHVEEFRTTVDFDETAPEFVEWAGGEPPSPALILEYLNAGDEPLQPEGVLNYMSEETRSVRAVEAFA